nr:hypothetical protein [Candidatus Woesebacteria bacterium]
DEKVPEVRHEIPKVSQFFIKAIKQSQADGFECRVNVSTDNKQELYQLLKNYTIMEDPSASFQEKQTASKELQKIYNYEFVFRTQFVSNLFNAPHKLSSRLKEIVEESDSEKIVVPHEVINEFYLDIFSSESFKLYYLGKSEEKYNDFLSIMEELRTNTLRDPARLVSRFILGPFTDGRTAILKTSYVLEDRDNPKFSVMDVIFQVANGEQSENGVVFSRTKVEEILEIVSNQVHLESWKGIAGQRAAVFEFNSVADAASFAKLLQN